MVDARAGPCTGDRAGNIIVGYNENTNNYTRGGSHNIVVGADHNYTSYSGIVSGHANQLTQNGAA